MNTAVLATARPRLDLWSVTSYGLTVTKTVLVVPLILLIAASDLRSAVWFGVSVVLIDIADGLVFDRSPLARDSRARRLRRVIDTISDRVVVLPPVVLLAMTGALNAWIFGLIATRELGLALAVGRPFVSSGRVLRPNLPSRLAAVGICAFSIYACLGRTTPMVLICSFVIASALGIYRYIVSPQEA